MWPALAVSRFPLSARAGYTRLKAELRTHRSGRAHHAEDQFLERHVGPRLRAADTVLAAVRTERVLELLEQAAVLLQCGFGDRDLLARLGFDVDQFQFAEQIRFGLQTVDKLDNVRLVVAVPQQV